MNETEIVDAQSDPWLAPGMRIASVLPLCATTARGLVLAREKMTARSSSASPGVMGGSQ